MFYAWSIMQVAPNRTYNYRNVYSISSHMSVRRNLPCFISPSWPNSQDRPLLLLGKPWSSPITITIPTPLRVVNWMQFKVSLDRTYLTCIRSRPHRFKVPCPKHRRPNTSVQMSAKPVRISLSQRTGNPHGIC